MVQNATLDGTSDRGGWITESAGTSNIHLSADTTTAGSDFIQGEVGFDSAPVGPAIFTLSNVTDPESAADHKIIYTALATAGGFMGTPGLTIALFESTTQRHSTTNNSVNTGSATEYTINLSSGEANSITNYDNLILRVTNAGAEMGDNIKVFNMYFQCGDASEEEEADTTSPAFLLFVN
jgi:hypothetical protein